MQAATTPAQIVLPWLVIAALGLGTVWLLWRRHWLGFAGAWFFLILAPTSSIMPIADIAVEHRMYLSLAAVIAVVGAAARMALARMSIPARWAPWTAAVVAVCVVVALGATTLRRNHDYRSEVAIYQTVVEVAPHNYRARNNLGQAFAGRRQLDEADRQFRKSLEIRPDYALAHNNLGNTLIPRRRLDEAIGHFRRALEFKADYADAHSNLAGALLLRYGAEKSAEAVRHLRQALEIKPGFAKAHSNLATALAAEGRFNEAIDHFRQAVRLRPDNARAHLGLADALAAQGQRSEAAVHYRKSLAIATAAGDAKLVTVIRRRLGGS